MPKTKHTNTAANEAATQPQNFKRKKHRQQQTHSFVSTTSQRNDQPIQLNSTREQRATTPTRDEVTTQQNKTQLNSTENHTANERPTPQSINQSKSSTQNTEPRQSQALSTSACMLSKSPRPRRRTKDEGIASRRQSTKVTKIPWIPSQLAHLSQSVSSFSSVDYSVFLRWCAGALVVGTLEVGMI